MFGNSSFGQAKYWGPQHQTKGEKYLERLRPDLMAMGVALQRAGMGSYKIQILLPGEVIGPELWAELDGTEYLGIPVSVLGDLEAPVVAMELKK